jgi:hypothetical protein
MCARWVFTVLLFAGIGIAEPVPTGMASVPSLFKSSDLVGVGRTTSVVAAPAAQGAAVDGRVVQATLALDKVYKGPADTGSILIEFPDEGTHAPRSFTYAPGEYVLVFLKKTDHSYAPTDRFFSRFPVSDKSAGGGAGISGLEQDLLSGLQDPDPKNASGNCLVLQGYDHLTSLDPVRALATATDKALALCAHGLLLRNGDVSILSEVTQFLLSQEGQAASMSSLVDLLDAVSRIRNRKAVGNLQQLAASDRVAFRRIAVETLRAIHAPAVVPILVQKLDDPDLEVCAQAVKGLAEIVHKQGEYNPGLSEFRRDRTQSVALWKQWWTAEGKLQYPLQKD